MPFGSYGGFGDYGNSYIDSPDPSGDSGGDSPDVGYGIKKIKDKFGRIYDVPDIIASDPGMTKDFIMRERESNPLKFNAPADVQARILPTAPKPVIPMPEQPNLAEKAYSGAGNLLSSINESNPYTFAKHVTSQWPSETLDEFMDTQKAMYKDAGESWDKAQSVGDYVGAGTKYAEWALPPLGQMFYGAGKKFENNDPVGGIGSSLGIGAAMFGEGGIENYRAGMPKFGKPGMPDYEAMGPPPDLQAIHETAPYGEVSNIPPEMKGGGLQDVTPFAHVDQGHVPGLPSGETEFPGLRSIVNQPDRMGNLDPRYQSEPPRVPTDRRGSFAEYTRRADLALGRNTPETPQVTNRDVFNNLVPESIKGPYLPSTNQSWMDAILPSAITRDANFGLGEPGRVVTDPFTGQTTRHLPMGVRDTPDVRGSIPEPPITDRFRNNEPPPVPIQPFEPNPEPPPITQPPVAELPAEPIPPIETTPPTPAEPIKPIEPPLAPVEPIKPPIQEPPKLTEPPPKLNIRKSEGGYEIISPVTGKVVGNIRKNWVPERNDFGWTHDGPNGSSTRFTTRVDALKDFVRQGGGKIEPGTVLPDKLYPRIPSTREGTPPVLRHPIAQQWMNRVYELDAAKAPDSAYRDIMSTAGKNPLKKGETWRERVLDGVNYFEKSALKSGKAPAAISEASIPFEPDFASESGAVGEHSAPPESPEGLTPVEDFGPGPHASVFDPHISPDTMGEQAPFKPGQDVHEFDPNIKPYDWNDEPFKSEVGHQQAFEPDKTLEDLKNPQKTAEIAQSVIDDAKKHVSGPDSPMEKAIAQAQAGVDAAAEKNKFANRQIEKASALKEGYNRYLGKSEEQTLEDMGPGGKELVRTMQRITSDAHNFAGEQGLSVEQAMKGMSKDQFAEAVDVREGKAKSSDPQVNALADTMKQQLEGQTTLDLYKVLKTKNPVTDRLYPFEPRENYFPRQYPEGFSVSEKSVPDLIKAIQDEATKDGKTITAERAQKIIDDAKESNYRTLDAMKSRLRDLPGYRKDFEVLMNHFIGMSKRAYEEIHFGTDTLQGAKDNHVNTQLDRIEKDFGHEARQRAEGIVSTFLDKSPSRTENWQSTAANALTSVQAFTKLSRSIIKNIPGGLTAGVTRGEMVPWVKSIVAPFTESGRNFAKESGTLVSLWRDSGKDIGYGSAGSKVFGVNMAEEYLRTFSGNLGKYEANVLFERIKGDISSGKTPKPRELAQLDDLLVEKDPMSVFNQEKLTPKQEARAANRMTDLTQGRADSLALPQKWTNNPSANILTQFKKFGFIQARNMKNALKQNPMAIPRVLAVQQVLGLAANATSSLVTGRKMKNTPIGLALENASYAFGFGMVSDLMQAAASGGERFVTSLAGPTVGDLGEIADVGKQVYDSKKKGAARLEPIAEFATKRIPFGGARIAKFMHDKAKSQ